MIEPICRMCHKTLDKLGGLIISPPILEPTPEVSEVHKRHLCVSCYVKVIHFIEGVTLEYKKLGENSG